MKILDINPHGQLPKPAARSYERLRRFCAAMGFTLRPTGPYDALRPYAVQEKIFRERYTTTYLAGRPSKFWNGVRWYQKPGTAMAATPGTSNHGKGLAVDFASLGGFNGAGYKLLAQYAKHFGWNNVEGRSIGEPWHWGYDVAADPQRGKVGLYRVVKGTGRKKYVRTYTTRKLGKKHRARTRAIGKNIKIIAIIGKWGLTKKGDWVRMPKLKKVTK